MGRLAAQFGLALSLWLGVLAGAAGQGAAPQKTATATFAGGCFWCVEADFDKVDGVISTTSGYTGGHTANPSYEDVSHGGTGHAEAVEIVYDPAKVKGFPAGSFVLIPAGLPHFVAARESAVIVQLSGGEKFRTEYVEK